MKPANAARILTVDLSTGAVTRGGKEITRGDIIDCSLEGLFGGPASGLSVEAGGSAVTAGQNLQISVNETDEFFYMFPGDSVDNEVINKIYLKRSGSGTVILRLTGRVVKKAMKPSERSEELDDRGS